VNLKTIVIDARSPVDGRSGGALWTTEGLLRGLLALEPGEEKYCVVATFQQRAYLESLIQGRARLVVDTPTSTSTSTSTRLRRIRRSARNLLGRIPTLERCYRASRDRLRPFRSANQPAGFSDPLLDSLGGDLVHFPMQRYFETPAPAVYNPHDLQHLHYPQFFTPEELAWRERIYRAGCFGAKFVPVSSEWVKRDLMAQYGVPENKIQVIPWGIEQTRTQFSERVLKDVRREIGLGNDEAFVLYPAATWEHKNHLRLLEAMALIGPNLDLRLICTGHRNDFYPVVERRIHELGLTERVIFPGVLPRDRIDALYAQAAMIVIPSLFEASSALLREAWRWERPVACAAVTSLPDQAGGSALLFDPMSPEAIADAMSRVALDQALRNRLVAVGKQRLARFTWQRTASAYRALYRSVLGSALTAEERELLAQDWMTSE
jgi:glycosyltransferase involved in cell wall biosynthesis